jgi:hypothetical protein
MAENRGIVHVGAGQVSVQDKPFPGLQAPRGKRVGRSVLLREAAPNILGFDQHMASGATPAEAPCQVTAVRHHFSDWLCLCFLSAAQAYAKGCFVCVEPEALEPAQEEVLLHRA